MDERKKTLNDGDEEQEEGEEGKRCSLVGCDDVAELMGRERDKQMGNKRLIRIV